MKDFLALFGVLLAMVGLVGLIVTGFWGVVIWVLVKAVTSG